MFCESGARTQIQASSRVRARKSGQTPKKFDKPTPHFVYWRRHAEGPSLLDGRFTVHSGDRDAARSVRCELAV